MFESGSMAFRERANGLIGAASIVLGRSHVVMMPNEVIKRNDPIDPASNCGIKIQVSERPGYFVSEMQADVDVAACGSPRFPESPSQSSA